jgi:AbrB family looped-hinge helix DNA binding protein
MGKNMGEATIDERGRIVIPNEIRTQLNLRQDQKLKVKARGRELIISPAVDPEEFIAHLKGCVTKSKVNVEDLKQIWGVEHSHD